MNQKDKIKKHRWNNPIKGSFLLLIKTFILLLFFTQCQHTTKNNFSVEGNFIAPLQLTMYLYQLELDDAILVDSVFTNNNGVFSYKGYCNQTTMFSLKLKDEYIYLIIKPGDKIELEIDNTISVLSYYVKGSPDSRLVNEISIANSRVREKINSISLEYEQSKLNSANFVEDKKRIDSLYNHLLADHKYFTIKLIEDNPKSLACIFALYQDFGSTRSMPLFDNYDDIDIFNFVDSNLTLLYPKVAPVIALNQDVTEAKNQLKQQIFSDKIIQVGKQAPTFSFNLIDGSKINSEIFKGKPVIYAFFAAWDKESINQIIELNNLYLTHKAKGLEIIGISFDTSKEKLESFLNENQIKFPIACDFKYWESEYVIQFGVKKIPDILLIDKNNIIQQRNINSSEAKLIIEEWRTNDTF